MLDFGESASLVCFHSENLNQSSIRTRIHRKEVSSEIPVCHQFVYILVWLWLSLRGSLHSLWGLEFMNFAGSDINTCNILYRLYVTYITYIYIIASFCCFSVHHLFSYLDPNKPKMAIGSMMNACDRAFQWPMALHLLREMSHQRLQGCQLSMGRWDRDLVLVGYMDPFNGWKLLTRGGIFCGGPGKTICFIWLVSPSNRWEFIWFHGLPVVEDWQIMSGYRIFSDHNYIAFACICPNGLCVMPTI